MAILKIARMGHPVLLQRAEPVSDPTDPEIRRLAADMIETMLDAGGVGLAGPQVHVPLRLFVMQLPGDRNEGESLAAVRGDQPGDRTFGRGAGAALGGLPVDPWACGPPCRAGCASAMPASIPATPRSAARWTAFMPMSCSTNTTIWTGSSTQCASPISPALGSTRNWRGFPRSLENRMRRMIAPPERSPARDAAIEAVLPLVPERSAGPAQRCAKRPGPHADLLFPGGGPDMVEAYIDLADRRMATGAARGDRGPAPDPACAHPDRYPVRGRRSRTRRRCAGQLSCWPILPMPGWRRAARPAPWMRSGSRPATPARISAGTPSARLLTAVYSSTLLYTG